jgi:hypothetical protein
MTSSPDGHFEMRMNDSMRLTFAFIRPAAPRQRLPTYPSCHSRAPLSSTSPQLLTLIAVRELTLKSLLTGRTSQCFWASLSG